MSFIFQTLFQNWSIKTVTGLYCLAYQPGLCHQTYLFPKLKDKEGMVDVSASKPALRQDTGYMVEKTYHDIAPYVGAFGAYLMPQ